jgi:hypothetical protein
VSLEFLKLFLAVERASAADEDKTHEAALLFPRSRGSRNIDDHAQVVSHQRPVPNGGFEALAVFTVRFLPRSSERSTPLRSTRSASPV